MRLSRTNNHQLITTINSLQSRDSHSHLYATLEDHVMMQAATLSTSVGPSRCSLRCKLAGTNRGWNEQTQTVLELQAQDSASTSFSADTASTTGRPSQTECILLLSRPAQHHHWLTGHNLSLTNVLCRQTVLVRPQKRMLEVYSSSLRKLS